MLRIVIIDDERKSRQSLQSLLSKYCTETEVVGSADGVQSGIACIQQHQPDLVLLDIQMQDGTGFDLLRQLQEHSFQLIFTTAHDQYAIKAFKFSAMDYLLKPIDVDELIAAIERARLARTKAPEADLGPQVDSLLVFNDADPRIVISTEQTMEVLGVGEIVRLQSDGPYTYFIRKNGTRILSSKTLKHYTALLKDYHFFRIHNSHLINLSYVSRLIKEGGGEVEMQNGDKVPISRRRKNEFIQLLTNR